MVPKYEFKYETMSAESGVYKYKLFITQSDVDANFAMFVPVFADFGQWHDAAWPRSRLWATARER